MELTSASVHSNTDAVFSPFWFDLWRNVGWSRRVARNWSQDSAYRGTDMSYLNVVIPTLAPHEKDFVERVLEEERQQS